MAIRLMTLEELTGHDVYELIYAHRWGERLPHAMQVAAFWTADNRYLSDDNDGQGIDALAPALSQVCPVFNWYGPNRLLLSQWRAVEAIHCRDHSEDRPFFQAVDCWLEEGNRGAGWFWLMGP